MSIAIKEQKWGGIREQENKKDMINYFLLLQTAGVKFMGNGP